MLTTKQKELVDYLILSARKYRTMDGNKWGLLNTYRNELERENLQEHDLTQIMVRLKGILDLD